MHPLALKLAWGLKDVYLQSQGHASASPCGTHTQPSNTLTFYDLDRAIGEGDTADRSTSTDSGKEAAIEVRCRRG